MVFESEVLKQFVTLEILVVTLLRFLNLGLFVDVIIFTHMTLVLDVFGVYEMLD